MTILNSISKEKSLLIYNKVEVLVITPQLVPIVKLITGEEIIQSKKVDLQDPLIKVGHLLTIQVGHQELKIMLLPTKMLLHTVKMLYLKVKMIIISIKDIFIIVVILGDKLTEKMHSLFLISMETTLVQEHLTVELILSQMVINQLVSQY